SRSARPNKGIALAGAELRYRSDRKPSNGLGNATLRPRAFLRARFGPVVDSRLRAPARLPKPEEMRGQPDRHCLARGGDCRNCSTNLRSQARASMRARVKVLPVRILSSRLEQRPAAPAGPACPARPR